MDKPRNDLATPLTKFCLAVEEHRRTTEGRVRTSMEFLQHFFPYNEAGSTDLVFRYLPREVRGRVRNFFANLADPFIGVNNLLQGKASEAFDDWTRFLLNSTAGLLGIYEVASDLGLEKHNEDFGQTFGRWGAGTCASRCRAKTPGSRTT